jgi:hypothetical protein
MRTGSEFLCFNYLNAITDTERFEAFDNHTSFYDSIAEELMKWLTDNWGRWEEEKLDWFTAATTSRIPEEMLPI